MFHHKFHHHFIITFVINYLIDRLDSFLWIDYNNIIVTVVSYHYSYDINIKCYFLMQVLILVAL